MRVKYQHEVAGAVGGTFMVLLPHAVVFGGGGKKNPLEASKDAWL